MITNVSKVYLVSKHIIYLLIIIVCSALALSCTEKVSAAPQTIAPNIFSVPTSSSTAYILLGKENVALVNSGGNPAAEEIIQALKQHNRSPENVRVVFTTSPHQDLNAGAAVFSQAITYTGMDDHRTMKADKHPKALLPKLKARLSPRPQPPKNISNVYPGDHLQTQGFKIDVVGTPGVSRDSMMYLYNGILFSGESLLIEDGQLKLAPRYQLASRSQAIKSLSRLTYLKFEKIADAYGETAKLGPKDVSTFIESLR